MRLLSHTYLPCLHPETPPDHSSSRGGEGRVKEHGIWGVILFVFGVTWSTQWRWLLLSGSLFEGQTAV